ncbi:EpsG family protein [Erwinia sorbitola]|uniref:EpsG family protein n=1 Tax=Erwinia sorbitola TaxID=2681984 RepID=A0A6I6EGI2_9GAMM|nr:EpsG family protein [Erwinia sorbitola]MTD26398.1 hypothetical protein [Erwinia sorbitola]QGU87015.1 hypothetical protein GN242_07205 [Erwinia sorbitola]
MIVLLIGTIPEARRFERVTLLFIMISLWLVVALSESVGPDYDSYRAMYDAQNNNFAKQEFMFRWIGNWLSGNGFSFQVFYFTMISLYLFFLYYVFKRYRNYLVLNFLIFIIMPYGLIEGGFTYIRQNVAIAIFYFSLIYLVERRLIKYFACAFVAMLFHKSAALVIPVYFLAKKKISSQKSLLIYFSVLTFSLLLILPAFRSLIFAGIGLIPGYGNTYLEFRGGEFLTTVSTKGMVSYVYQALPIILLMIYRNSVVKSEIDNVLYNLTLFSLIALTLALQMRIMLRVEYYFVIAKVFSIPLLLNACETKRNRTISLLAMIAYFSIYFVALYYTGAEKHLFPYRTIFGFEVL